VQLLDTIRHQVVLAGRVIDATTKAPLAGALVWLKTGPATWTAWLTARAAGYGERWEKLPIRPDRQYTAPDGTFRFIDLPAGAYTLAASLPGAGKRYSVVEGQATVTAPDNEGRVRPAVVELSLPSTSVQGRVLLPNGDAMHGATVLVLGSGETAFTNADGKYLFAGLEPGKRTLRPSAAGFGPQQTQVVELKSADDPVTLDFVLVST